MSDPESSNLWLDTGTFPDLHEGDVQIWRLDLNGPESHVLLAQAFEALTPEERQRASRMRTGTAPEEFIAGRGSLRRLLGAFLNCDPHIVKVVLGAHRKPALRPVRGIRMPHFNVSHSAGMILIALSRTGTVGVDVEYMDPTVEAIDVARAAFHPDDFRRIESAVTSREKLLAFYGCWTRREAVAKADGRGLTLPASGFATGTASGAEQMIELSNDRSVGSVHHSVSRYFVRSLSVGAGHLGSFALACSCKNPTFLHWSRAQSEQKSQHQFHCLHASNTITLGNQHAIVSK